MLIRFDSKVGSFLILEEFAVPLIRMTGHSGTVPSAILAKDIPAALASLKAEIARTPVLPEPDDDERPREERPVSLRQRAFPLVDLLERAARKGHDVMWEEVSPEDSVR